MNNVLFINPSSAQRIYKTQLRWLEERLRYARDHDAKQIYGKFPVVILNLLTLYHHNLIFWLWLIGLAVFGHHPWFLYDEDEEPESLTGASPCPPEWQSSSSTNQTFPDAYFSMPKKYRSQALELFQKYKVNACFSGHFHQNLISKTRWGMDMIITAPLSVVFDSTGKEVDREKKSRLSRRKMTFESEEAMLFDSDSSDPEEPNCRGVRIVDVEVNDSAATSSFSHWFVSL